LTSSEKVAVKLSCALAVVELREHVFM
jgi:hypothetical protein